MVTPHVFVVNERTFPLHLRYRFAGTTPGRPSERHIGLLADIARVRPGDPVIFYLIGYGFYGVFRIAEIPYPFWEKPDGWLQSELGIPLIYQVLIDPLEVYRRPVSEWEAIDRLPMYSREVRWSLLYRKLRGERGCSYLFLHEYNSLRELLRYHNPDGPIANPSTQNELTWVDGEIQLTNDAKKGYQGSQLSPISHIDPRRGETHLQAWFVWHIGKDQSLNQVLGGDSEWFANEVYAGSGMQKMDVLCILSRNNNREFRIIELKDEENDADDLGQLRRYIWWVKDYLWNDGDKIQPVWVSKGFKDLDLAKEKARMISAQEKCE